MSLFQAALILLKVLIHFFVSIGPQLSDNISCETNPLTYVNNIERSIVILDVTCEEVKCVIHSLNNSSSGCDEIPTFLVKKCVDSFIEPLTYLVNASISEGIFPSELKLARVVLIFKSGDPSLITNYRPISVLSLFSKVFEKIMYYHIIIILYYILWKKNRFFYMTSILDLDRNIQLIMQSSCL